MEPSAAPEPKRVAPSGKKVIVAVDDGAADAAKRDPDPLMAALTDAGLGAYAGDIVDRLGLERIEHLAVLDDAGVMQIGLKPVQRHLLLALVATERCRVRCQLAAAGGRRDREVARADDGAGRRASLVQFLAGAGLERHADQLIDGLGLEHVGQLGLLEDNDLQDIELRPAQRRMLMSVAGLARSASLQRRPPGDRQALVEALTAHGLAAHADGIADDLGLKSLDDVTLLQGADVEGLGLKPVQHRLLQDFVRKHKVSALGLAKGRLNLQQVTVTDPNLIKEVVFDDANEAIKGVPADPAVASGKCKAGADLSLFAGADKTLPEVAEALAISDEAFPMHLAAIASLPPERKKPLHVALYLFEQQVLLTSKQAKQTFDFLLPSLTAYGFPGLSVRGELVFMLHSFCLEPFAIWENDDGAGGHIWRSMSWAGLRPSDSSAYYKVIDGTRVGVKLVGREYQQDTAVLVRPPRQDINNLRAVLLRRDEGAEGNSLEVACFPSFNAPNNTWRQLADKVTKVAA